MTLHTEQDPELRAQPVAAGPALFDIRRIWASVYRARWWVAAIFAACLNEAKVIALHTTPLYRAETTVQIDQEAQKVLGTEQGDANSSLQDSERFLQTNIDIIQSRAVALKVASDLNLFRNPGFLEQMGLSDSPVVQAGSDEQGNRELVLSILQGNLEIDLPLNSRIAKVQFTAPNAPLSAQVANSFADSFIRSNLERKFDQSSYARNFLADQLKQAQDRLGQTERQALDYARRAQIVDTGSAENAKGGQATSGSLTTATLIQLNDARAAAVAARINSEGAWRQAGSAPLLSIPQVLANQAVQQLVQQRATLSAAYEEERALRKEDYPAVKQLRAQLKEIDDQVRTLASAIKASLREEYETALTRERTLDAKVDQLKSQTLGEQQQGIELSILRRGVDTNRQQYDALLQRYNELNAEAGVQTNNVTVIDKAIPPASPFWPNLPLNLALGLLAGIGLSGLFVFGREQLFDHIRTPEDIADRLPLPMLGAIPRVAEGLDIMEELRDPKSAIAESFNTIRTALSLTSTSGCPRTMTFISTQASEGKSTACYGVALGLSRLGKRVIVIDLDLRRPNVHRLFGLGNGVGMSNVLAGEIDVKDAIQTNTASGVAAITGGAVPPNPTDLLTGSRLNTVLEKLTDEFDVVCVDSAPLLGLADALIVAGTVERTVFVVEAGRNRTRSVVDAINRLSSANAQFAGVVLSRFDPSLSGYGSNYYYAYQYSYKSEG